MIHFDTSFLVDLLRERRRKQPGPAHRCLDELPGGEEGRASLHAVCELHAGAALAQDPASERRRVQRIVGVLSVAIPDEEEFPRTYGRLLAELQRAGTPVGVMDLLIATAAVRDSAPLVTGNPKHFRLIRELEVVTYRSDRRSP